MRTIRVTTLLLLLLVISIPAIAGEVVIPFMSGQAEMTDAGDGLIIPVIPGFASFTSPGDPSLPYMKTRVLLPPNADVSTLRVEIRNPVEEELPNTYEVAPTPPITSTYEGKIIEDWQGKQIVDARSIAVYEKDEFFPMDYVELGYYERLDNFLLVPIQFWPYRYNPVTGKMLHLVSGDAAIIFDTIAAAPQLTPAAPLMVDRLSEYAQNWSRAADWYPVQRITTAEPMSPIPFTIITTSNIVSNSTKLADYVAHKTNMGFSVTVATESDWGGGIGNTAAENIRAWLQANYQTKAHYAVFIGNPSPSTGDVPFKKLWPHGYPDGEDGGPSDYYYADLTGNWDLDGDGYYGEYSDFGAGGIDLVPEVITGRIPYYGVMTDLDKILQKIINYESASSVGTWAQRMMLAMKPLDPGTTLCELGEAIRNDVAKPGSLGYYRIYDYDYVFYYGQDRLIMPPPEKTPCNETNVNTEWRKGYAFMFWGTHGWPQGACEIITSAQCPYLDDSKPAFTFQGSCSNGYPEAPDNLGYSLLKNGAIGTVSATRVAWYYPGETTFDNSDSAPGMTYAYALQLARDRKRCGDAYYAVNSLSPGIWANHVVFNLYGDPTVAPQWPTTSLKVETSSLPIGRVGAEYGADLIASGGTAPYSWTLADGSLPPGLTLNQTGIISGSPQVPGIYTFTVEVTDDDGVMITRVLFIEVKIQAYYFGLDSNPGWNCEGLWAFGVPKGGGSYDKDPTSGHTGGNVYGYNLNGDYTNGMTVKYLTTTAIDCSSLSNTNLVFWRRLGVDVPFYDKLSADRASIQVSNNGSTWLTVWSNSDRISDTKWVRHTVDLSYAADGCSTVYVRWGMGPTDSSNTYPGWNIDDIEIEGLPTKPHIRHTPLSDTTITTGYYNITADVIASSGGGLLPGSPVLSWKTTGGFTDVVMTQLSGNTYEAVIPAQPAGTTISYYISAADANGTATSPAAAPTVCHEFHIFVDTIPPTIAHTPLPNTWDTSMPYYIFATVTDNVGVQSVSLTYAKNGGTPVTVAMVKTIDNPNGYIISIPNTATYGDWFTYKITAIDASEQALQSNNPYIGWHLFSILPAPSCVYSFPLSSNPGWSCEGLWAFGTPTGGGYKDPTSGHTGSSVYGYNLNGDYENHLASPLYLTTTPIDCSWLTNTTLKYWRWLGVAGGMDKANIEVYNGSSWSEVYSTDYMWERSWTLEEVNISSIADLKPSIRIRWGMGPTDSSYTACGWNIDDVEIWGCLHDPVSSISALKQMQNNELVRLSSGIISAAYNNNGFFYVQQPGLYHGIRIAWPGNVVEGFEIAINGMLRVRDGELEIVAETIAPVKWVGAVQPIAMNLPALGGGDFGLQPGVWSYKDTLVPAEGLNNIGALVKVAGKVTQVGADYFYIDDGSGIKDGTLTGDTPNVGVRISWLGAGFLPGQFVTVVGVSSGFINNGVYLRCVLPRRSEDIELLQ